MSPFTSILFQRLFWKLVRFLGNSTRIQVHSLIEDKAYSPTSYNYVYYDLNYPKMLLTNQSKYLFDYERAASWFANLVYPFLIISLEFRRTNWKQVEKFVTTVSYDYCASWCEYQFKRENQYVLHIKKIIVFSYISDCWLVLF